MRRLHGIVFGSLTALLLSSAIPTAEAAPELPTAPSGPSCPTTGLPDQTSFTTDGSQTFFQGDLRLGPKDLPKPKDGPIGELLDKYNRFQAMGPKQFIDCYWAVNAISPTTGKVVTGWRYPPDDGFAPGTRKKDQPVNAGERLQLFGNPGDVNRTPPGGGKFLAPAGTLYEQSAIPPSNLDTFTTNFPFNYHLYCVRETFTADEGLAAPWFQQPGGGPQYFTGQQTVGDLTKAGNLIDITKDPTKPCPSS